MVYVCCVTVFSSGSDLVNQYSLLYFSELGKREGINFHYMYTEIIKSRSTFEDLPIPVTPFCLHYQGLYGPGKLALRVTVIALTC